MFFRSSSPGSRALRFVVCGVASASLLAASVARAENEETPTARGAGAGVVAVRVDVAARVIEHRACSAAPCNAAGGEKYAIALPAGEIAAEVETIAVGEGRSVTHVIAHPKANPASARWEALIAVNDSGKSQIVFAGPTGFSQGEGGERRGDAIQIFPRDGGGKFVVVGALNESVSLCGEPKTLLEPRALDPKTMTLRPASVQQLSPERRAKATRIVARVRKEPLEKPLGSLLVAIGGTDERTNASALVDGNPATHWNEARSGIGAGDLVAMRAPNRVPIARLSIQPFPPAPAEDAKKGAKPAAPVSGNANASANAVAPKSILLVSDDKVYAIELPEDASVTRAVFDVTLPAPLHTSCLAVVLDEAYSRGLARPEVTLSELVAYSELDKPGATLADVARSLSGAAGGQSAEVAAEVMKRSGPSAATAILQAFPTLDTAGRMLGLEVAKAAGGCDEGARVMIFALSDGDQDVAARADKMLTTCGSAAAPRLLEAVDKDEPMTKGRAAGVLALVAPTRGLRPIGFSLGQGDVRARALLRSAFARAAKRAEPSALSELLTEVPVMARPEMLRALSGRLADIRERASLATNAWLEKDPSFASRYLALEPLAELARAGDSAATTRFVAMLEGDPEWGVRAHAAALSRPVPAAHGALLRKLEDAEPRVREAALRAVGEHGTSAAAVRVGALLAHDPWTFVRTAAAAALGGMAPAPDLDRLLADALNDPLPAVKVEALESLARHRAAAFAGPVRERLQDDREALDVRVSAVATLGRMCDGESLDYFTKQARKLSLPFPERTDIDLGAASIRALAVVHPKDLERRLAPLMAKDVKPAVREAATRALSERGDCR